MSTRLIELVEKLPACKVALVGDLMLDRYLYGNADRVSPEAPVPVLHYQSEEFRLGGAANVAANLAVLGAAVHVIGLVGDDTPGEQIQRKLAEYKIDTRSIVRAPHRPTICKMRLVGSSQHKNPQQLMRLDFEDPAPIDEALSRKILDAVRESLQDADVLCVEDYNKGLCTPGLMPEIIALARAKNLPVIIDPANIPDWRKYSNATAIKSNRPEAERATGLPLRGEEQFAPAAQTILNKLNLEALVITLDRHGSYLATKDDSRWIKTRERQVADGTGAGDMVLAMLTMARAAGATWPEAVTLANIAGGLEVERFGVVPIQRQEIIAELLSESRAISGKLRTLNQLLPELQRHRSAGKRIVFTKGCFDIIHVGHVKYFQFAKAQGDLLIVGVNTDAGIRRLKGPKRPIINEEDRVGVLEELESIDYLLTFDEDTPENLVHAIRPDVLVKGADYSKENVVGASFVESYGGKIALAPLIDGRSTSTVIQKILEAHK